MLNNRSNYHAASLAYLEAWLEVRLEAFDVRQDGFGSLLLTALSQYRRTKLFGVSPPLSPKPTVKDEETRRMKRKMLLLMLLMSEKKWVKKSVYEIGHGL
ncbi:hypothetical protein PIB30_049144 [Stylosanthes scabra]|uniref:Uncharacterized protein n=1 Tax=Stylosanthes scabra TaxID=79078 RepID=A0ABU6YHR1_9FABA|nr:hypothetical protein [Stylosanthes scabra]